MSLPHYDEAAPLEGLEKAGVTIDRSTTTQSFEIQGIDVASSAAEHYTFTLPQAAAFKGGFGKEGFVQKLAKIFAKEIQAGDPIFDDKVYVRGSDQNIGRFLQSDAVQTLILDVVAPGGSIAVDGNKVHIAAKVDAATSDRDIARLVCHIMAFS